MTAMISARFSSAEAARRAAVSLERHGVEAQDITVATDDSVPTSLGVRNADYGATQEIAKRAISGGSIGGAVGALVGAGVVLLLGLEPLGLALVFGVLAGAIAGTVLGGFWTAGAAIPVNEEAFDTYVPQGSASLAVRAPDLAAADQIRARVERLDAIDVQVTEHTD